MIGTGRPTLMLPGGPGLGAAYMRDQAELFADTLESYLIDPHGSGRSTPPREASAYSPEGHAAFYDEVRQALGLGDVMLLGHSFGATTALTYAALFPERVIGCIAVAAFGIGPDTGTAAASAAEAEYERALVRHAGAEWYSEARPVIDEWTERVLATDDPHKVEGMSRLMFPITSPTLVVAGELDFLCGPAQAQPICAAIPGAHLEIIRDCGHFPTLEAPEAYSDAVQRFLAA